MAVAVQIQILNLAGDEADRRAFSTQKNSYTYWMGLTLSLAADTKTELKLPFSTVKLLYVEGSSDFQVFKNLSPESWTADGVFLVFDTSIAQLHLLSATAQTLQIFVGGE